MHGHRVTFLAGLATGYVLGAKAGRERYEQIRKLARTVAEHPAVQQAAGVVQAQAAAAAASAREKVGDELAQRAGQARQKVSGRLPGRGSHADQPLASVNGHHG